MNLEFKRCTTDDLDELINISVLTFRKAFEASNDPAYFEAYIKDAFSSDSIKKQLQNDHSTFYFIYDNDDLIAYIKINEQGSQSETFEEPSIELERIYVLPKIYW